MSTAEVVDRVTTPRGELVLRRVGEHHEIVSNGIFLMDTRDGRSERLLVRAAVEAHGDPRSVLIGGLGMGFSLAEATRFPSLSTVTVVEVEELVVGWHDGPLADVSGGALRDPRVEVVVADLRDHLRDHVRRYDVICLDVDNGPDWTVTDSNTGLYGPAGLAAIQRRLRPGGVLAVWSARAVPAYEDLLRGLGLRVEARSVEVPRGEPDVVYVATAPPPLTASAAP